MKKLLLIPALIATIAMATENETQYDWEITPQIGYDHTNLNDPHDYGMLGGEIQYNGFESKIKPELSFLVADEADYDNGNDSDLLRIALNGVYDFDKYTIDDIGSVTPLIKAGIGYEYSDEEDKALFDVGAGIKVPFSDSIALKLEALYILATDGDDIENNLALLAGLNIAFGERAQKPAPKASTPTPVATAAPVVAAAAVAAAVVAVPVDGDDDKDGVLNSIDECPNSLPNAAVNEVGCQIVINLHVNFDFDSSALNPNDRHKGLEFVEILNTYKHYNARIVGHTDNQGNSEYNKILSEKRANAVKEWLIKQGIDSSRLTAIAKGDTDPIATNKTRAGRAENRRVEAELLNQ